LVFLPRIWATGEENVDFSTPGSIKLAMYHRVENTFGVEREAFMLKSYSWRRPHTTSTSNTKINTAHIYRLIEALAAGSFWHLCFTPRHYFSLSDPFCRKTITATSSELVLGYLTRDRGSASHFTTAQATHQCGVGRHYRAEYRETRKRAICDSLVHSHPKWRTR
jgi:hypothetical protein